MSSNIIIILNLFLILCTNLSLYSQLDTNYFLTPPEEWNLVGEATIKDYQQCFGYGDFNDDTKSELVGNYSHSAIGLFIHNKDSNGKWKASIIHPKFDPDNRIKGMSGSWPVKGFITGDFDDDGVMEIITYADQIMYPLAHAEARYPFPGCIYIDWDNNQKKFIANPLVWGEWGENICSNKAAIQTVLPISSQFRSDSSISNLSDFLVRTMCNDVKDSRLFVLEQPKETFNSFDFRYVTHDSIDIDPDSLYKNDAFYVHRFYLETQGGDIELYFSHSDTQFENVTTASCNGNIFDYDNDGLFDLFVTVEYYDNDTSFIEQHCGSSIRIYHRLSAKQGRRYRFKEVFRKDLAGLGLGHPVPANLNGKESDGKEGWLIPVNIDTSMSNDLNTAPGVVAVYKVGSDWVISGTFPDSTSVKKYIGVYSGVCVYDVDNDGYDDAIIKMDVVPRVVPYKTSEKYMTGDLKLFRNMRTDVREYKELFAHSSEASTILWPDDAFSWDVHLEDFDDDGEKELGCSLARRESAWTNPPGNFGIYFTELEWEPTSINFYKKKRYRSKTCRIFPNPATDFINISNRGLQPSVEVSVFNVLGVKVMSVSLVDELQRLDVSGLPTGLYFMYLGGKMLKFLKI